jgi:hypothetical protein
MSRYKGNKEKLGYFIQKLSNYGAIALLSVVLLSESVGARDTLKHLQIAQQPVTTQPDATRAEAEKLSNEGMQLYQQGSAESLLAARQKWEQALVLWRKLGNKGWQAVTLLGIGNVYDNLGDKLRSLRRFHFSSHRLVMSTII